MGDYVFIYGTSEIFNNFPYTSDQWLKVCKKPYFGNLEVKVGWALNIFIYMVLN